MSDWSTPGDIRNRVRRDWDNGRILAAMLDGEPVFPLRISLKKPNTQALSEHFEAARQWVAELTAATGFQLEWREFNHRQLGRNRIPVAAIVASERDGLALIGKLRDASQFRVLAATLSEIYPALVPWLRKRPLTVLDHVENWPRLMAVLDWIMCHPRSGVYLRQIDVRGVDTKFIERHRGLLGELLDSILPPEVIDTQFTGANGFALRYGFKRKPEQVRIRFLDRKFSIQGLPDIAVTSNEFARMALPVKRVFVTENEINFLSFPDVTDSVMLFGGGYGFDHLARAEWLQSKEIFYWGDIDTHGFTILDQLRSKFPAAHSLLMDRATLLEHQALWGVEDSPTVRELERLQPDELALYDDLRFNRIAPALRLEQERIGFAWVEVALVGAGFR
ncbi:MAG: cytoplasmic protein [Gallionellaceae bacterium]|nr:MAG: cytoplasmic protein [Gallionellaceae bacterium]